MARAGTRILDTGDTFPDLNLTTVDGAEISTRSGLKEAWVALIIYRGVWCPFCISQLKSFQTGLEKLSGRDRSPCPVRRAPDKARETQKLTGATFPIAYGVPVRETAEATGAFFEPAPTHTSPFLQSAGFVLGPDRRVMVSAYSSGVLGRITWQDVLALVPHMKAAAK